MFDLELWTIAINLDIKLQLYNLACDTITLHTLILIFKISSCKFHSNGFWPKYKGLIIPFLTTRTTFDDLHKTQGIIVEKNKNCFKHLSCVAISDTSIKGNKNDKQQISKKKKKKSHEFIWIDPIL